MKKTTGIITVTVLLLIASVQCVFAQNYTPLEMGVNVNERPHWLHEKMLEQSNTTWTRAFVEASHYIKGERSLQDDFRIDALKRVAGEGYKVLLSIKWDIREAGWRVPDPGSREEKLWFEFAGNLLNELEGDLSMIVLVNEITIDTPEEDLQPNESGVIPFVRFQKRLLDYVSELNPRGADGNSLPIYTGGFTRLDLKKQQTHPSNRAVFKWINEEDRLSGADFHIHQPDYKTSLEATDFIRKVIPDKSLIVTEFSLVWKWKAHMQDKIGRTQKGRDFAENNNVDSTITVAEYSTRAFRKPVSETEWNNFLNSQPWFESDYLDIMGRIMENAEVDLATYAFTQRPGLHDNWKVTKKTNPWFVHQLFIPHLISDSGKVSANYEFLESFRRWQETTKKIGSEID